MSTPGDSVEPGRKGALERAFAGGVGSVLAPLVLFASVAYGNAVMSDEVQMRAGWFVVQWILGPLFLLGIVSCVQGIAGLLRWRRLGGALGRPKACASSVLLVIGVGTHVYMAGRVVAAVLEMHRA